MVQHGLLFFFMVTMFYHGQPIETIKNNDKKHACMVNHGEQVLLAILQNNAFGHLHSFCVVCEAWQALRDYFFFVRRLSVRHSFSSHHAFSSHFFITL